MDAPGHWNVDECASDAAKKMKRALPGAFVPHASSPYLSLFDGS